MSLFLPKDVIEWLDANRGSVSRQVFILNMILRKMDEVSSK